jgi:hypothetical protein
MLSFVCLSVLLGTVFGIACAAVIIWSILLFCIRKKLGFGAA